MGAWPSATAISTTNLDADADSPLSARPQLKTAVDDLNLAKAATATETTRGPIEISTDAEITTGTDDTRAVSPKKLATRLTPPAASGFVGGLFRHVHNDSTVTTQIDVDSVVTASTWESIGPTGSGASNIWAAMDVIPAGAVAVVLHVIGTIAGATTSTVYNLALYARVTGSSTAANSNTQIALAKAYNQSGTNAQGGFIHEVTIPLDSSRRFDLYWSESGTSPTSSILAGLAGFISP